MCRESRGGRRLWPMSTTNYCLASSRPLRRKAALPPRHFCIEPYMAGDGRGSLAHQERRDARRGRRSRSANRDHTPRGASARSSPLRRSRRIRSLTPREPDPEATEPQPVIWWELLRAGYDPVRLPEPIHSPVSRLTGRPWRILRKGAFQIPVFRVEGEGPDKLYPKHAVRAAAYCALLEQSAGGRSPSPIALFAGAYKGWTLPNSTAARAFLDKALAAARTSLPPELMIGPPASLGLCAGCPHGAPRPYRRGETETTLFG